MCLEAPGRVPTFFDKPVACLDKILLFIGAVLSSLLFAVHNMLSSPWDLIYVAAGCLLLPAALSTISGFVANPSAPLKTTLKARPWSSRSLRTVPLSSILLNEMIGLQHLLVYSSIMFFLMSELQGHPVPDHSEESRDPASAPKGR